MTLTTLFTLYLALGLSSACLRRREGLSRQDALLAGLIWPILLGAQGIRAVMGVMLSGEAGAIGR